MATANPHAARFRKFHKQACDKLGLASTYLDDGAMLTAAKLFRESADLLEKANVERNKYMGR